MRVYLEAMIMANEQRERNNEQKAREFTKLKEIEVERAKERQLAGKNLPENLPEGRNGDSRDLAAAKVGMSGKTAEKAAEVVQVIDAMEQTGETGKALQKLNQGGHNSDSQRHHTAKADGETHFKFFHVAF